MKVTQIIFSPTGGTRRVVETITSQWDGTVEEVDLTNAETDFSVFHFDRDDVVVIAVPSYGGRVPALAAERIQKIHGNQARCIIICVYGNRAYEDTLIELNDISEQSGFHVIAGVCAVAEHSIMHQYATGRPDQQDQRELHSFAEKISAKIKNTDDTSVLQIPGKRPYKKAGGAGLVPKADKHCTGCGLCAKNCPAQAISGENLKTADSKKCISCMRCVTACPAKARKVNEVMVSAVALAIKKACLERKSNELYI